MEKGFLKLSERVNRNHRDILNEIREKRTILRKYFGLHET